MKSFAVVGMGSIANRHVANLRFLHPDSKIYVVSSSGKNSLLLKHADEILAFDELVARQPHYVIVASPAPFHAGITKKLLAKNIPVLIEKPVAHTYDEALDLLTYINNSPLKCVTVGYCLRFLPSARFIKLYLESGKIGAIYNIQASVGQYLPDWRPGKNYKDSVSANRELGGGALLELSHELDYLIWLFGNLTLHHSWLRTTSELDLNVEEIVDLTMTLNSGTHVSVHLDFIQKSTQRKCEIIGEKGRLVWDLIGNSVTLYHGRTVEVLYSDADYDKNNMYVDMLVAFEEEIQNHSSNLVMLTSSVKVMELVDEAHKTNQWRKSA